MVPATTPLIRFNGEIIWPLRQISLLMNIEDEEHSTSALMNFVIARSSAPYNGIIGRPVVRKIQAVPSTAHEMLKFPVAGGILTLKSSKIIPNKCATISGPEGQPSAINQAIEERIKKLADMTGVPRHIAEHRLNVQEGCPPVRQKKRGQAADRIQAIQEEVKKLVDAGIMKEVHYHSWNLEVYVDDLVIKIRMKDEIIRDIEETFKTLREINMKLNLKKCTFGVEEGMFLGYKVNTKGIKVCPDKADVVLSLSSLKCLKDVQKLNGKLARLNRFLAKSAEKSLPFFKNLKKCTKKSDFHWTEETESAFKQMKQLIAKLPMLTAPEEKEKLIVYLAAAKEAPRLERSRSELHTNEKIGHGTSTCQQASETILPSTPNYSGHGPTHKASVVKTRNFIVERPEEDSLDTPMEIEEELSGPWILFTDGSSCADGSGARLILTNPEGTEFTHALRFRFEATNNEAEYEALIAGLRIAEQMGVKNLQPNVDSRLLANQVNGTNIAKEADMIQYLEKVRTLTNSFRMFSIKQVPRSENKKADALSKIASTSFAHLSKQVLVEELKDKRNSSSKGKQGKSGVTQVTTIRRDQWGPVQEIFSRTMAMHAGTRSVVAKALQTEYYWPTMHKNARALIRACQDCQVHRPVLRNPQQNLTPITSPWPFYKWGIDIAGPFQEGPGKVKFLIVAIDYFTKWIEAKPVATITEAVIPTELGMPTLRTAEVDMVQNDEALEINLDLLEEMRDQAVIREAKSKAKMEKYYNSKVRSTSFKPRDLVYHSNDTSGAEEGGKLGPKWEGPYKVTEALGKGAYKLRDCNGKQLSRTWNVCNLKKCYVYEI
ncbi:reverse transcriptase domain-containing protein [Tanacetum coccineum]